MRQKVVRRTSGGFEYAWGSPGGRGDNQGADKANDSRVIAGDSANYANLCGCLLNRCCIKKTAAP